ncbi:helix-turn-helix transcriptional regulator [Pseudoduganella umbonata]|uniref:Putative DNA-binding transcriptional regulator YafY n=1 Tax=Pseudoduganella umbonata TaxID=864828 RepID=A0A4P8HXG7_9BURK|nr:WYL domain-containing transcriptional regulator [Pseudoduganella umbonata]MBB3223456.1 putative DNA-binding transcriptional regulator YafY [Pseudoduganella umbonata]QCP13652.1 WYL domain-containing transcriptional regulator [Pseudoduganella umbonata]
MATNEKSLLRQWHMLKLLPRAPAKITVKQLCELLAASDYDVSDRTIQRDLKDLTEVFDLEYDDRSKPFGWSWSRIGAGFNLPGISVPEALTLKLVEQHLRNHLPPNTTEVLQPYFEAAARTLATVESDTPSKTWLGKVRSIVPAQPLLPPVLNEQVRDTVYAALMQDHQLAISYRKRDAVSPVHYPSIHPVAIVQRGGVIYLVCMFGDYENARTLALHRIVAAEDRFEPARKCPGFDLDAYVASGQFGIVTGPPARLRAVFRRQAGEHLFETPLCVAQELEVLDDGRIALTATVPNTRALLWWLLGFGDGVEVLEPVELREEIAGMVRNMARLYG